MLSVSNILIVLINRSRFKDLQRKGSFAIKSGEFSDIGLSNAKTWFKNITTYMKVVFGDLNHIFKPL